MVWSDKGFPHLFHTMEPSPDCVSPPNLHPSIQSHDFFFFFLIITIVTTLFSDRDMIWWTTALNFVCFRFTYQNTYKQTLLHHTLKCYFLKIKWEINSKNLNRCYFWADSWWIGFQLGHIETTETRGSHTQDPSQWACRWVLGMVAIGPQMGARTRLIGPKGHLWPHLETTRLMPVYGRATLYSVGPKAQQTGGTKIDPVLLHGPSEGCSNGSENITSLTIIVSIIRGFTIISQRSVCLPSIDHDYTYTQLSIYFNWSLVI